MTLTRRDVIRISGGALAGLSAGPLKPEELRSEPRRGMAGELKRTSRDGLAEVQLRDRAELPLNPDGSAPEHSESEAGPMEGSTDGTGNPPVIWRRGLVDGEAPEIEFNYRRMRVQVDPRGLARLGGTMTFDDLEPLPLVSNAFLLQCAAPYPKGIVKWTGVRFRDFAEMLSVQEHTRGKGYCRFVASDRYYVDEAVTTLLHPQVMLAWLMNDEPIPPEHGAPLRLIIPFRYGARNLKAITEIHFGTPRLPQPDATLRVSF